MAKRRSKAQIQADQIIKKNLFKLGEEIKREAKKRTRVLSGELKKSIVFMVKPDTVLTLEQNAYGSEVNPTKQYDKGEPDALLITIKEMVPKGIEIVKKELIESVMYPFRK